MRRVWMAAGLALVTALAAAEVNQSWLGKVPAAERARVNPYGGHSDAVAAGGRLYAEHCEACHGADLNGRRGRPSLLAPVVQGAADGELFWLLRNGDLRHGMPSWSGLPEQQRWEIVTYIKAAGVKGQER